MLSKGARVKFKVIKTWIAIALLATCGLGCSSQQVNGTIGTLLGLGAAYGISQAFRK